MGGVAAAHVPAGVFASFVSSPYPRGFGELYIKKKKKRAAGSEGELAAPQGGNEAGLCGAYPSLGRNFVFLPRTDKDLLSPVPVHRGILVSYLAGRPIALCLCFCYLFIYLF